MSNLETKIEEVYDRLDDIESKVDLLIDLIQNLDVQSNDRWQNKVYDNNGDQYDDNY